MMDQREHATAVDEVTRQVMGNCGRPEHGLLLHLPTVGPVRVWEGDGCLLLDAGDGLGGSHMPALLGPERVEELRDFLSSWLAARTP